MSNYSKKTYRNASLFLLLLGLALLVPVAMAEISSDDAENIDIAKKTVIWNFSSEEQPVILQLAGDQVSCKLCLSNCRDIRERDKSNCCTSNGGTPGNGGGSCDNPRNGYSACLKKVSDAAKRCEKSCKNACEY